VRSSSAAPPPRFHKSFEAFTSPGRCAASSRGHGCLHARRLSSRTVFRTIHRTYRSPAFEVAGSLGSMQATDNAVKLGRPTKCATMPCRSCLHLCIGAQLPYHSELPAANIIRLTERFQETENTRIRYEAVKIWGCHRSPQQSSRHMERLRLAFCYPNSSRPPGPRRDTDAITEIIRSMSGHTEDSR